MTAMRHAYTCHTFHASIVRKASLDECENGPQSILRFDWTVYSLQDNSMNLVGLEVGIIYCTTLVSCKGDK